MKARALILGKWRCVWFDRVTMRFDLILSLSKDEASVSRFFCIALAPDRAPDGFGVETPLADDDEAACAPLAGLPRAVELMLDALPYALHDKAHGFALDLGEALNSQNVMGRHRPRQPSEQNPPATPAAAPR